jgi:RNA polymerase sigma-70 factor (ECF subfamily)
MTTDHPPADGWDALQRHRERLVRFVRARLDRRLQGRIDASDVVQEACAEAFQRRAEYDRDRSVPFYVWLRFLTAQRLALAYRRHLGTHQRDAGRDVPWPHQGDASADMLADHFAASQTSPSGTAAKAEWRDRLRAALEAMPATDREMLALRHFEQLSNGEAAAVTGLTPSAASHRYARALIRLKAVLQELFGSDSGEEAKP